MKVLILPYINILKMIKVVDLLKKCYESKKKKNPQVRLSWSSYFSNTAKGKVHILIVQQEFAYLIAEGTK